MIVRRRGGRVGAIIFSFLGWLLGDADGAALQIERGPYSSGKAFVSGVVDGAKERFLLDTGSAMTLVKGKRYVGYTNSGQFRFKSAAGIEQSSTFIRLSSLRIDTSVFTNVMVGRPDFAHSENTLGIDILGQRTFALVFKPKPALVLNVQGMPGPPEKLLPSDHGHLLIPVTIGESQSGGMWDTGSGTTFVDPEFIKSHQDDFKATNIYMSGFDGAGKSLLLQLFRARKITVGRVGFENVNVVSGSMSLPPELAAKQVSVVVGFNLIRQANWYFDPANGLWNCVKPAGAGAG